MRSPEFSITFPWCISTDSGAPPFRFIDEFRNRSWMPVEPKHLDYENAQILLIGESFDSSHALDATSKDKKADDKETPQEELEKLEGEDESRVKNLRGTSSALPTCSPLGEPMHLADFFFAFSFVFMQVTILFSMTFPSARKNTPWFPRRGDVTVRRASWALHLIFSHTHLLCEKKKRRKKEEKKSAYHEM